MSDPHAGLRADLAAFTAAGDVAEIWSIGSDPVDLVFRDGWLVHRAPGHVLPQDAPIARLGRSPRESRPGTDLVVDGANLLLGGRRVRPGKPQVLADGDTLVIDHRDIGEPASAVLGGLLIRLPPVSPRQFTWLVEVGPGAVDAERPGAGRALGLAGIAAAALGALPSAVAALTRPAGSRSRETLVFAALGIGILGAAALGASRMLAMSGSHVEFDRSAVSRTLSGLGNRSGRWSAADVDGVTVRLGAAGDRWLLSPILRVRGAEVPLEVGAHLSIRRGSPLPHVAAIEARRLDWIEIASRIAGTLGRAVDAFVVVQVDPAWPPERARAAIAAGRISLP